MSPRSSRNHCTFVPAVSMIASRPQVIRPSRRHATIGNVPDFPRRPPPGDSAPRTTSSMPPVPKVILAARGRTHPCPTSEACWSPSNAAIGGAPGNARAWPVTPVESTMRGSIVAGMPSISTVRGFHADGVSMTCKPVIAAFDASVTCTVLSDSVHATHVSTVPKHSSDARDGSGSCSSSHCSFVADSFGPTRTPCACSARHAPTVRRSCQPMPGPTGSPVARSHTIADPRWFEMPTPSTGPSAPSASRARSRHMRAIARASNSTSPSAGCSGKSSRMHASRSTPPASKTHARMVLVPTSMTSTRPVSATGSRRGGCATRACPDSSCRWGRARP